MSSLVIGSVVISRVQFVELFSRNLPARRDDQDARIDGGYRRANARLEKRAWRIRSRGEGEEPRLES